MHQLINKYFELSKFKDWQECESHFKNYLNDEMVLEVSFIFFGRDVLWQMSMEDLHHEYIRYTMKKV